MFTIFDIYLLDTGPALFYIVDWKGRETMKAFMSIPMFEGHTLEQELTLADALAEMAIAEAKRILETLSCIRQKSVSKQSMI